MYFWDILINIDNLYFQYHGQFSLKKFSKTHSRTPGKLTYRGGMVPLKNVHLVEFQYINIGGLTLSVHLVEEI